VGGIVGFMRSITWIVDTIHTSRVVVVWEAGGSSRKRKLFPGYKERRRPQRLNRYYGDDIPESVENRNWQVATIVSLLEDVGVGQIYVPDCEADDVIGYLARYRFPERQKVILSSDKDFYQLLGDDVRIYNPMGKRFVEASDVLDRFGVTAQNFCTAKALCGDTSDNVPGIKGMGFKTAAKRFTRLGTTEEVSVQDVIDEAAARIDPKGKGPKIYGRIVEGEDVIHRNWKLMFLDTENLSAYQIRKIDNAIDTFTPQRDKMSLVRKVLKGGIGSLDVDRLFLTCRAYLTE